MWSPLLSILVCKIHFLTQKYQFVQLIVPFQKVGTLRFLKICIIIRLLAGAKYPFLKFQRRYGRYLPIKELLNTQDLLKLYLTICDLPFKVWYNLIYLYFREYKRPSLQLDFHYNQQSNTIFRTIAGICGVMTYQKVILKTCHAYRVH